MENKTKSIIIIGKKWFQKTYGNTYFSSNIYVNGKIVYHIAFKYGYGDQYFHSSIEWLKNNGYLPDIESDSIFQYCEKHEIELVYNCSKVSCKKDL